MKHVRCACHSRKFCCGHDFDVNSSKNKDDDDEYPLCKEQEWHRFRYPEVGGSFRSAVLKFKISKNIWRPCTQHETVLSGDCVYAHESAEMHKQAFLSTLSLPGVIEILYFKHGLT